MGRTPVRHRPGRRPTVALGVAAVLAGASLVSACGGDGDDGGGGEAAAGTGGGLVVDGAWAAQAEDVAAVYLRIDNGGGADRLVGATTEAAGAVSVMAESAGTATHDGADEAVAMDVPPGTTTLSPGAGHVMLSDLARPLEPGDEVELRLSFEDAGDRTVPVEVLSWHEAVERNESGPT